MTYGAAAAVDSTQQYYISSLNAFVRSNMDAFVVKKSPSDTLQQPTTIVEKKAPHGALLPANKRPLAAGAAPAKKKGKPAKIGGMTVEQHRRALGDAVKSKISVEKWAVEAKTHCAITDVDAAVFEALVVPNAAKVTPADFDVTPRRLTLEEEGRLACLAQREQALQVARY